MKKIFEEITAAEKDAGKIIADARKKADMLRNELEKENSIKLSNAKKKGHELVKEHLVKVRETVTKEQNLRIKEAESRNSKLFNNENKNVAITIDDVVKLIITPEYLKKV